VAVGKSFVVLLGKDVSLSEQMLKKQRKKNRQKERENRNDSQMHEMTLGRSTDARNYSFKNEDERVKYDNYANQ